MGGLLVGELGLFVGVVGFGVGVVFWCLFMLFLEVFDEVDVCGCYVVVVVVWEVEVMVLLF